MNRQIQITVDDRETHPELLKCLFDCDEITCSKQRLKTGDFIIENKIFVERKTATDFSKSLIEGRLFSQAKRLAQAHSPKYLIFEGCFQSENVGKMSEKAIRGAIISLNIKFGIPVLNVASPEETVRTLIFLGKQIQNLPNGLVTVGGYRPKTRKGKQLRLLQTLPFVGPNRATQLLDKFGSVRSIVNSSEEELASIEGIGPKVAQSIREIVEEKRVYYNLKIK